MKKKIPIFFTIYDYSVVSLYINRVLVTEIQGKYNFTSLMFRRSHKVITTVNGVFAFGGNNGAAKVLKNIKSQVPNRTQAYKIL